MKSNLLFILLAACLLAFTACQTTSQPDLTQIKKDIQEMEISWATFLNFKDAEATEGVAA